MSPKAPTTAVDPELAQRRASTRQMLDLVFPEISKALPKKDIEAVFVEVEAEEVAAFGSDPKRAHNGPAHFLIAGRLWTQHWDKLLVSAVQHRLGPSVAITDTQVFTAADALPPPKPVNKSDGATWLEFSNAVARQVQARLPSGEAQASSSGGETPEWQSAFATDFDQRLRSLLAKPRR